jgi:flavin-dependent dehydrogenase
MALRTGELAAQAIIAGKQRPDSILREYSLSYDQEFGHRLRAASRLRRIAFSPNAARFAAQILAHIPGLTNFVFRATRSTANSQS